MRNQTNLVDIEALLKSYNGSFSRYASPDLNSKVFSILKIADLDPHTDRLTEYLKNVKTLDDVSRNTLRFIVQHRRIDYSRGWYQLLKTKINEFHRRYARVNLIKENSTKVFRTLFKLHVKLSLEYVLYDEANTQELDYFIAAQFAKHYHAERGLVGKVTLKIFEYRTCYDNYLELKRQGYSPSLISTPKEPIYIKEPLDKKMFFDIQKLKDKDCSSFTFIEQPLLNGKIPRITGLDAKATKEYLTTLEFLIVRAKLLNRNYNKFILSIEHMRVCKHVQILVGR
jgi:hypothetical protein